MFPNTSSALTSSPTGSPPRPDAQALPGAAAADPAADPRESDSSDAQTSLFAALLDVELGAPAATGTGPEPVGVDPAAEGGVLPPGPIPGKELPVPQAPLPVATSPTGTVGVRAAGLPHGAGTVTAAGPGAMAGTGVAAPGSVVGAGEGEARTESSMYRDGVPIVAGQDAQTRGGASAEPARSPETALGAVAQSADARVEASRAPTGAREDAALNARSPEFSDALGERIRWQIGARTQQAEIRLNPPELGSLDIRVRTVDGETTIALSAASGAARDALEAALPRLREFLDANGVRLAGIDVSSGDTGARADAGAGEAGGRRDDAGRSEPESPDEPEPLPSSAGGLRRSMIDDFA